jgi:AcrR family transcriptional regulator
VTVPVGESKGERTRRSILEAAIVRFAREGFKGTSLTAVARDAGLSPTGIYPYFDNKEALFVAAVDEDAAGEIEDGLSGVTPEALIGDWRHVIVGFLDALDRHPLARRVLAGLEPEFTVRLIGIPALDQMRKGLADSLELLQIQGGVRTDLDARAMASGFMTIWLSLLMSLVQTGATPVELLGEDVVAVFDAAMRPLR